MGRRSGKHGEQGCLVEFVMQIQVGDFFIDESC